jgi:hypothetical protein
VTRRSDTSHFIGLSLWIEFHKPAPCDFETLSAFIRTSRAEIFCVCSRLNVVDPSSAVQKSLARICGLMMPIGEWACEPSRRYPNSCAATIARIVASLALPRGGATLRFDHKRNHRRLPSHPHRGRRRGRYLPPVSGPDAQCAG